MKIIINQSLVSSLADEERIIETVSVDMLKDDVQGAKGEQPVEVKLIRERVRVYFDVCADNGTVITRSYVDSTPGTLDEDIRRHVRETIREGDIKGITADDGTLAEELPQAIEEVYTERPGLVAFFRRLVGLE